MRTQFRTYTKPMTKHEREIELELSKYRRIETEIHNRRRINQIEDALARPVEEGRDWNIRRSQLEQELLELRRS